MNLTGNLLIAMPGMGDPRFAHAVIYITAHSEAGAMGLMVNKPASDLKLADVLDQLVEGPTPKAGAMGVHIGGPVEMGRGFVLHSDDYASQIETLKIMDGISLTATLDILEDIAAGRGPTLALMMLGYAGWGPGQLEAEISMNGWLTSAASTSLIFDVADTQKWAAALEALGIDPLSLSATAGHA